MPGINEVKDIFETKTSPSTGDNNVFNQKVKEFFGTPPTATANSQPNNQRAEVPIINNIVEKTTLLKKNKSFFNKKILIISVLVVFFMALSAGAYFYLTKKVSAKELVDFMIINLVDAKGLHYTGEISLNNDFSAALKLAGDVDDFDPQNKKTAVVINAVISSGLIKITPEVELRTLGQEKYLRIKIDNLPFIEQLSTFNNQWIKFNLNSLKEFIQVKVNINNEASEEKSTQINNLIKQSKFFINLKDLDDEIINDRKTRHLTFEIDKQELKNFFINASKIYDNELSAEQLKSLDENLAKAPVFGGEMWIDDALHNLVKITLPVILDDQDEKMTLDIKFELSNYNIPANITAPQNFKTMDELQKLIEQQMLNYYATPATDDQDSDNDGLTDIMEKIYDTDPKNSDTDDDGYKDGEEVKNGYNPLGSGKLLIN